MKTEISVILQIAALHPEPAPGAAELRPLAASIWQEPVPPRPIKTLPTNGDLFVSVTSSLIWWIIAFINETDSEIWWTETCGRIMVVMTTGWLVDMVMNVSGWRDLSAGRSTSEDAAHAQWWAQVRRRGLKGGVYIDDETKQEVRPHFSQTSS